MPPEIQRRALLVGLASLIAMPSIVRANSLMPVRGDVYRLWQSRTPMLPPLLDPYTPDFAKNYLGPNGRLYEGTWTFFGRSRNIYEDECVAFSKREYGPPNNTGGADNG